MSQAIPPELQTLLENLQSQVAALSARLAQVEKQPAAPTVAPPPPQPAPEPAPQPPAETISEEELLAISAALAAVFGVRMHIRQIRLISSRAWAQEGRVSIQASHRLHT